MARIVIVVVTVVSLAATVLLLVRQHAAGTPVRQAVTRAG
jgi:hypothetical protein